MFRREIFRLSDPGRAIIRYQIPIQNGGMTSIKDIFQTLIKINLQEVSIFKNYVKFNSLLDVYYILYSSH